MRTVDERRIAAPADRVFAAAADVERWPGILPHYRYVRMEERRADLAIVAMSANRPFGPLNWPTWWTSEMWVDAPRREVLSRLVAATGPALQNMERLAAGLRDDPAA